MKKLFIFCFLVLDIVVDCSAQQWFQSEVINQRIINSITIFNKNNVVLVGGNEYNDSIQTIFKTYDQGYSFIYTSCPCLPPTGLTSWLKSAAFRDTLNGLACGFNGKILSTPDGGLTWNCVGSPIDRHFNKVCYAGAAGAFIAGGWDNGDSFHPNPTQTIIKSTDSGQTWATAFDTLGPWLTSVSFSSPTNGVAVGLAGTILHTTNAGVLWTRVTPPLGRDFNDVTFVNADTGFIVGGQLTNDSIRTMLITTNGGANWSVLMDELGGMLTSVSFVNNNQGYVAGDMATFMETGDGGANWTLIPVTGAAAGEYFPAVSFFDSTFGIISSTTGYIYVFIPAQVPQVYTLSSEPTDSSAVLYASINTFDNPCTYTFIYSTDSTFQSAYSTTVPVNISCDSLNIVTSTVTGLGANKRYYYYISASGLAGTSTGDTLSFYTGTPFSVFATGQASDITTSSAVLTGTIEQATGPINLFFEYDTSPVFGNQVVAMPVSVNDTALHNITASVSQLLPYKVYYFRLKGMYGNSYYYGDTHTFYTGLPFSALQTRPAMVSGDTVVTLNGFADGFIVPVTFNFRLGTSPSLNSMVEAFPGFTGDTAAYNLTLTTDTLQKNNLYYFCVQAQTMYGTFYGDTLTFYLGNLYAGFQTLGATGVTVNSAVIHGSAAGLTLPTALSFEYGTTPALGNIIQATPDSVSDTIAYSISAPLGNLLPNTLYYYRMHGSTSAGSFDANIQQVYVGDCEVPNCDFESWYALTEPQPVGWNIIGSVQKVPSYNGSNAVQLTGDLTGQPGAIITGNPSTKGVYIYGGFPFTAHPDSLTFHAKYNIAAGDTAFVGTLFKSGGRVIDTLLVPVVGNSGGNWVYFEVPVNLPANASPDTAAMLVVSSNVFAQNTNPNSVLAVDDILFTGTTQLIPDYNFEAWDSVSGLRVQSWYCNAYGQLSNLQQANVFRVTDRVSGNYAIKLATDSNSTELTLQTGNQSSENYNVPTFPLSIAHQTLNMYLKFFPVANDTLEINLQLFKNSFLIGGSYASIDTGIPVYTGLSMDINYFGQVTPPDSATINFNFGTLSSLPGSVLYIDDISFDGFRTTGINQDFAAQNNDNRWCIIFPNPASSSVNVYLLSPAKSTLQIYDALGSLIDEKEFEGTGYELNTSNFPDGIYLLKVNQNNRVFVDKLVVNH